MTQAITQKAVLKTLKILATRIKEWQQPLQNTKPPQAQKQQGSRDQRALRRVRSPLSFEGIDRLEHGVSGLNAFRIGFISPLSGD